MRCIIPCGILFFCAINRRDVFGTGELWVFWFVVLEFNKDIGDVSWHGNVTCEFLIIPF